MNWKRAQSQKRFPTMFCWAKSPWRQPESICLPWKLGRPSMKIPWNLVIFMDRRLSFCGRQIDSGCLHRLFAQRNTIWNLLCLWPLLLVILGAKTYLKLQDTNRTHLNSNRKGFLNPLLHPNNHFKTQFNCRTYCRCIHLVLYRVAII